MNHYNFIRKNLIIVSYNDANIKFKLNNHVLLKICKKKINSLRHQNELLVGRLD